ncbi:MAG: phosphatidate cytidylyltransferase [Spirochaetales bacterium]|nr:phosphatidate cytidylyltransferase [Spirochaetales bacterium]
MKNFWARVLTLVIFFPLLAVVIVPLGFLHHLIFNVLVTAVAFLGALEMRKMFEKKKMPVMRVVSPILAATLPAVVYLEGMDILPEGFLTFWIAVVLGAFFVITVCVNRKEILIQRLPLLASSVVVLFIPAFFLTFIVRITSLKHPDIALLFFLAAVFFNDILAYLAGLIARGKTRLNLLVSPNKSLIGFIFGFAASVGTVVAGSFIFKKFFVMSVPAAILLGSLLALTSFAGDLFESALKRSCQIKDSGVVMAGRGGIMDAIDSLLLSAPLFLFLFPLLAASVP